MEAKVEKLEYLKNQAKLEMIESLAYKIETVCSINLRKGKKKATPPSSNENFLLIPPLNGTSN